MLELNNVRFRPKADTIALLVGMPYYCPNCSNEVDGNSALCGACGANFTSDSGWKALTAKPAVQRRSSSGYVGSAGYVAWFGAKVIAATAFALTAVCMGLIAVMALIENDIVSLLHISLAAFLGSYVIAMVVAALFAYFVFRSAQKDYAAYKALRKSGR